ncbi:MAG: hypothetical protein WA962_05195 [Ornithinimicrobium sp.]
MTSTTESTINAAQHGSQWRRSTRILLRVSLERAAWFWALAVVVIAAVLFTISRAIDPQMSAVQFAYHGTLWYQFAMMIAVFIGYAGAHVANGMTRRSFTLGSLITAAVTAAVNAAVITVLLVLEQWIYAQSGWYHGRSNIDAEVLTNGLWPYVWGGVVIFVAGNLSGLLVAATYYRVGGWWGTLCLPLTLAPLLLVSVFALDHEVQWTPWDLTTDVLGTGRVVLAIVVIAVGALAYSLMVRRIPIATHPS